MVLNSLENEVIEGKVFTENSQLGHDVDECVFKNCMFKAPEIVAAFSFCQFINCQFDHTEFYWALMHDNKFFDCDFTKTTFAGVTLTRSEFLNCHFKSAIFMPSNIGGGCDLTGVVIRDCKAGLFMSYNSTIDEDNEISSILVRKTIENMSLDQLNNLRFDA